MDLNANMINQQLKGNFPGNIIVKNQVDSTQLVAQSKSDGRPLAVLANQQTRAYGKKGRSFFAPSDVGLYLSVFIPHIDKSELPQAGLFTTSLAITVVKILERYYECEHFSVKWVNDILLHSQKVGGILVENTVMGSRVNWTVGIGLNLKTKVFPQNLASMASGIDPRIEIDRNKLAANIISAIWNLKFNYQNGSLLPEYRKRLEMLDHMVTVNVGLKQLQGIAKNIDDQGRLVLELRDGSSQVLSAGEVTKIRY